MSKSVQIKINVFKECGTCRYIGFSNDWATAKCSLTDEIVIKNAFSDNRKEKEPCDKWQFNYSLLEDSDCGYIDLESSINGVNK